MTAKQKVITENLETLPLYYGRSLQGVERTAFKTESTEERVCRDDYMIISALTFQLCDVRVQHDF